MRLLPGARKRFAIHRQTGDLAGGLGIGAPVIKIPPKWPDCASKPLLALHFDPDEPREPRYDLARRLREREIESFTVLAHGSLEPNPAYSPPPQPRSERIPYLLYALVIPLVGGLGWYVARTIQRGVPD